MLTISVICVGKLKEKFYCDAAAEYEKRLSRFCRLQIEELPEERLPDRPSDAQRAAALEKEGREIAARLPRDAAVIALCVEGEPESSEAFAERLEKLAGSGRSRAVFVIGGSEGLHASVKERAEFRLSMSPMTFPHHLARVMLLEQLYRAFQIRAGTRYHK